jgi:hypothetical protein
LPSVDEKILMHKLYPTALFRGFLTGLSLLLCATVFSQSSITIVDSPAVGNGVIGVAYGPVTFAATGGTAPYHFSAIGLPPGLTLSDSGVLSGTPSQAGSFNITVTARDANLDTGQINVGVKTWPSHSYGLGTLISIPWRLAIGTYGTPYGIGLVFANGTRPKIDFVSTGNPNGVDAPPPGVSISSDGIVSGTPTKAGDYVFVVHDNTPEYSTVEMIITPATLTIVPADTSATYGSMMPALTISYKGFVLGDSVSSLTTMPTITANAAPFSPVGNYAITTSGAVAPTHQSPNFYESPYYSYDIPNYTIAYDTGWLTINPAPLKVTASNDSMTYGGNLPALSVTYSGFVNGENASVLVSQPTDSTSATSGSPVGVYPITATGAADSNYSFTYVPGTLTINPAPLKVTASSDSIIYGGTLPALSVNYSGFVNGENASILAKQPTDSTSATSGSPVGVYPITATGAADSNYSFTYVPGTLTINPAPLTVTAGTDSMTYGGTLPALSVKYRGFVNGENASMLTKQPTDSTSATSGSPVGVYPITASGAADSNYSFTYVPGTLTIGRAALKVTASNDSMTYGGNLPALSVSYSGFVNGENASVLASQPTDSTSATSGSPVGVYPITATGAADSNYSFTYVPGWLTINPAPLTVTASNDSMTYGGNLPALSVSYSGFVNGENASFLASQPTDSTTATSRSPAGVYPITATGAADSNYSFTYVPGWLTINPAPLTVTASNDSMTYGGTLPALSVTYSGFVNGENASVLVSQPTDSTTATSKSPAGVYPITATGAADSNYSFTYVPGTLTIGRAALTVTANNDSMTYGGTLPALSVSYSGFVNGENASFLASQPTDSTTATSKSPVGVYPIVAGGAADSNYNFTYIPGTLTITKAPQQITWNQSLLFGCDSTRQLQLTATVTSGLPITYTSADPGVATVAGDALTLVQPGTAIITAAQPGDTNHLAAADVANTAIYESPSLVRQHWGDVLFFDNTSDQYIQWQWYKNGNLIPGAVDPYYSEPPALNGQYYVIATDNAGHPVQTCPLTITGGGAVGGGIKVFPNPVSGGAFLSITSNYTTAALQGARMQIIDISGKVWKQITNVQPSMQVTMPAMGGIYVIDLQLSNGQKASVNVLVNE